MLRTCSGAHVGGRLILAALAGMALACSDERSGAGPGAADPLPPDPEVGADAPLDPLPSLARHHSTGADGHFDLVKTPATVVPLSITASSTSVRPL